MGLNDIFLGHRLYIDQLVVIGFDGEKWFDECFYDGVNVIYGLSESGKTPILFLIRRALGLEADYKEELASQLQEIKLYFSIDELHFRSNYFFKDEAWQFYKIQEPFDEVIASDPEEISKYILNLLEISEEKVPDAHSKVGEKTVGLANFFYAWYVNQKTGYNTIIHQHDQKIRRIIFESLINLDLSAASSRLQFLLEIQEKQLANLNQEENHYRTVKQKLKLSEESELEASLEKERALLDKYKLEYENLQKLDIPMTQINVAEKLHSELEAIQREINLITFERNSINEAFNNAKQNKTISESRLKELSQINIAENILSVYSFCSCPRCNQTISKEMEKREFTKEPSCMLCGRKLTVQNENNRNEISEEQERLEAEIKIEKENLRTLQDDINRNDQEVKRLNSLADKIRNELSVLTENNVQPKLHALTAIHEQIERTNMRIYQLSLKINFKELLDPVQKRIEEINKKVQEEQDKYQTFKHSEEGQKLLDEEQERLNLFINENQRFINGMFRAQRQFTLEGKGSKKYMPKLNNESFEVFNANEPYRVVIAYYLSMLSLSLKEKTRYPRFLIFDTPRQQDADDDLFEDIVKQITSLTNGIDTKFQILITGSGEGIKKAASSSKHIIEIPKGEKTLRSR